MTRRYMSRPQGYTFAWDYETVDTLAGTVIEEDRQPVRVGLLDSHGNDIYAVEEADPIGFVRFGEGARD